MCLTTKYINEILPRGFQVTNLFETVKADAVELLLKKSPEGNSRAIHERKCSLCKIHDIK